MGQERVCRKTEYIWKKKSFQKWKIWSSKWKPNELGDIQLKRDKQRGSKENDKNATQKSTENIKKC